MNWGTEGVNRIWWATKLRAVGIKRATTLRETAKNSIGLKKSTAVAAYEMKMLLADYDYKKAPYDSIMEEIARPCRKIPESGQMLAIKGIGLITVAFFF